MVLLLACAAVVGLGFARLGVPGGLVVGAIVGAGGASLVRGGAEVVLPGPVRTAALVVLGANIGATVTGETVGELRGVLLPADLAAGLIIVAGVAARLRTAQAAPAPAGMRGTPEPRRVCGDRLAGWPGEHPAAWRLDRRQALRQAAGGAC